MGEKISVTAIIQINNFPSGDQVTEKPQLSKKNEELHIGFTLYTILYQLIFNSLLPMDDDTSC